MTKTVFFLAKGRNIFPFRSTVQGHIPSVLRLGKSKNSEGVPRKRNYFMAKACCSCLQSLNYHKLVTQTAFNLQQPGVVVTNEVALFRKLILTSRGHCVNWIEIKAYSQNEQASSLTLSWLRSCCWQQAWINEVMFKLISHLKLTVRLFLNELVLLTRVRL